MSSNLLHAGIPWVAGGYRPGSRQKTGQYSLSDRDQFDFILGPEQTSPEYIDFIRPETPAKAQARRVRSATYERLHYGSDSNHGPSRPSSANLPRESEPYRQTRTSRGISARRVRSAGTLRTGVTPSCRNYKDAREPYPSRKQLRPGTAPAHLYPGRHNRCHGHTNLNVKLLLNRSRTGNRIHRTNHDAQDVIYTQKGPALAWENDAQKYGEYWEENQITPQQARYIDYMRPRTAPPGSRVYGRSHLKSEPAVPSSHFCNFVKQVKLQDRDVRSDPPVTSRYHGRRQAFEDGDMEDDIASKVKDSGAGGKGPGHGEGDISNRSSGLVARPGSPVSSEEGDKQSNQHAEKPVAQEDLTLKQKKSESSVNRIPVPTPISKSQHPPDGPTAAWEEKAEATVKIPTSTQPTDKAPPSSQEKKNLRPKTNVKTPRSPAVGEEEDQGKRRTRSCVHKKEKKPVERVRKAKTDPEPVVMEQSEEEVKEVAASPTEPEPVNESPQEKPPPSVPELPQYVPPSSSGSRKNSHTSKTGMTMISSADHLKTQKKEVQDHEIRPQVREYEFNVTPLQPEETPIKEITIRQRTLSGKVKISSTKNGSTPLATAGEPLSFVFRFEETGTPGGRKLALQNDSGSAEYRIAIENKTGFLEQNAINDKNNLTSMEDKITALLHGPRLSVCESNLQKNGSIKWEDSNSSNNENIAYEAEKDASAITKSKKIKMKKKVSKKKKELKRKKNKGNYNPGESGLSFKEGADHIKDLDDCPSKEILNKDLLPGEDDLDKDPLSDTMPSMYNKSYTFSTSYMEYQDKAEIDFEIQQRKARMRQKLSESQNLDGGEGQGVHGEGDLEAEGQNKDNADGEAEEDAEFSGRFQPWLRCRLALSQQACRFELPMDMKVLEKLSPQEYLRKYCILSSRRQTLYQKIFMRNKNRNGKMAIKELEKGLKEALTYTITAEQLQQLYQLVEVNDESDVDYKLFAGMAAMSERIMYPDFITEDTRDIAEHKKEKIESADFCGLEWKFHGVNVNPPVRKILESL